ncbi:PRC-barrel domain-containing protein [Corallococcus sicarius]|uniref:PRC-barrel domain containing protein n=1 Tax=Corallococcus sicarius TaxID=2316726 RepID=A0A3A8NQ47_9BACT|nr:PRC-barrel domain-containing protein [Corallococcus sicarius]RKH46486.1 PRC-barrel domain containing protein [Corallococcus sicarius]
MRFSEGVLKGRTVVADGGQELGTVETLVIDGASWRVEALQVKLNSETAEKLGKYWNYFHAGRIELPIRLVHSVSDTVLLSATMDELRQVLASDSESAPAP